MSCLPGPGELVPCVRHGYCRTVSVARGRGSGPRRPRPPRRTEAELVQWLVERPATTIGVLRRHRFTLRLVVTAERSGRVEVDPDTGRVTAVLRA
ncbi:hypothetical protein [Klenkia taihuensis]|uniref:hypothetical protein n=1 Tax=Klenkia taihuensis TaxID=1225127 RepID=UPI0013F6084E|nr:hypothetical protein [Klenkia taihuensis]